MIQAGFAIELLAAVALLTEPALPLLVLCLFLFLTGYIMLGPALPASLARGYGSSDYGAVMGGYSMFLFAGSFLGATVSGLIYAGGLAWIGISLVILSLTGSWMNIRLREKEGLSANELDADKIDNCSKSG